LGGKSPAIVGRGIDVGEAAGKIMFGKCLNAGQTCIAPDYALVPEESIDAFVAAARASVERMYPGLATNPQHSSIGNGRHRARLRALPGEARQAGPRTGEATPGGGALAASTKIAPQFLVSPGAGLRVMREEIFGPLLPVVGYRDTRDAIAYVNARPRP